MMMRVDSDSLGIGAVIAQFTDMHGKWNCTVSGMPTIYDPKYV